MRTWTLKHERAIKHWYIAIAVTVTLVLQVLEVTGHLP